ncbi:MAG TPA: polysaccharide deacetylase family protein [Candidatus Limnocylindrales bacterium]
MGQLTRREFLRTGAWLMIGAAGGASLLREVLTELDQGEAPAAVAAALVPTPGPPATGQPIAPAPAPPAGFPAIPDPGADGEPPAIQMARWPAPTPGLTPPTDRTLRVPILMYHRIVDPAQAGDSLPGLVVPPTLFAAQMRALHAAGWRTITAAELASSLQHGTAVAPGTFVVTIDDGWRDGYTEALPVLQSCGYRATYFVIGKRIGARRSLGGDELQALAAAGMEIGDHTFDHHALPSLAAVMRRFEITAGADRIAQAVGQPPVTFCYPDGRYSPDVEVQVAQAGFGLAVTTKPGTGASWSTRYAIPRLRVTPGTTPAALLARMQLAQLVG